MMTTYRPSLLGQALCNFRIADQPARILWILECKAGYAVPDGTDSIVVDELPWHGRFVKRAPNTILIPLDLRP